MHSHTILYSTAFFTAIFITVYKHMFFSKFLTQKKSLSEGASINYMFPNI